MGHSDQIQICPIVEIWQNWWVSDELLRYVMNKAIKILIVMVVVIISTLPLILYFVKFGLNSDFTFNTTLTHNMDDWGAFGGFIGGTVGPVVSIIAFIGIWKTYTLQSLQLKQANNQRKSEDVQRLIASTSERIDSLLYKSKEIFVDFQGERTSYNHDIHNSIAMIFNIIKTPDHEFKNCLSQIMDSISVELIFLSEDIETLSWLLEYQVSIFKEETLKDYYYYRYRMILTMMYKANLSLQPITLRVFQLNEEKNSV
ncbi:TPA: hypothetical protein RUY97_003030 [Aeromonas dhakensis]|nr:hypothetical protein [Aeromonas dhakensis]HDX8483456.1 hypothetical protein [Aeromonas dhakensis]HDX8510668.1 hypothetical protein [Aeromonas dhakensis]HDX8638718.1 hypothetical protein [Aeromonas dhakensis]HDZ8904290.1 hypothetical protein [Aeromonas dhakensis]